MGLGYIGGSTKCEIQLFPSETWASGNQRTVKLNFDAKVKGGSQSWFGYAVDYRVLIHGQATGWNKLKGTETWRGTDGRRQFSQTLTVDVGTSEARIISVGVELRCRDASWNGTYSENFQVSQTNIAPGQPGWIQVRTNSGSGPVLDGFISEKINNFYITWGAVTDGNGDTVYYDLQEQRNNGDWYSIDGDGTDTAHHFSTVGGEGTSYKYCVNARDNKGGHSAWTYSPLLTKNTFTMATLACSSSIEYQGGPLYFTFNGGKNTQPGVGITYSLECEGLKVYNASNIVSGTNVFINWGQGGVTNGPYINWSDITKIFGTPDKQGKGTLTFVLKGVNSNGTEKSSKVTIPVNIQHQPSAFKSYISTNSSESTAYRQVKDTKNWYFIPDGGNIVMVKWASAAGSVGDSVKYRIYVAYGSGDWEEVTTTTQTSFGHMIPRQTVSAQVRYKIKAMSSYNEGQFTESYTPAQTLHYYNTPGLVRGHITRGMNSAAVNITVKSNSSIPNINTVGTWRCNNGQSGKLNPSQNSQTINLSNLTESGTYNLTVTYTDSTGFSSNRTETIAVGATVPFFYINRYGIGVGGEKATENHALRVKGDSYITGNIVVDGGLTLGQIESSNFVAGKNLTGSNNAQNANNIWRSGFYDYDRGANYPTSNTWYLLSNVAHTNNNKNTRYNLQTAAPIGGGNRFFMRNTNERGVADWQELYHTGKKPTASEIGALPSGTRAKDIGGLPANTKAKDIGAFPATGGIIKGWFGVNSGTLSAGHDFNGYLTEGEYNVAVNGSVRNPPFRDAGLYGKLIVKVNDGDTHNNAGNWIWQIFLSANGDRDDIYVRRKINHFSWGSWRKVSFTAAYGLNEIDELELMEREYDKIAALEQEVAELKETVKMLMERINP